MRRIRGLLASALLIFLAVSGGVFLHTSGSQRRHFELSEELQFSFTNADEVIETIHAGLTKHASAFTISYRAAESDFEKVQELADELMNCAMYNTEAPTEGDYVRYQYGGYRLNFEKTEEKNDSKYQLVITPIYYSTVEEEQRVDAKVTEILAELGLKKDTSDREKVQAVYDYICRNVKYDHVHANSSRYHKDSTAYAALVQNYASCQGYAVAVFRLLKEVGAECTIVTGIGINEDGDSEFHAWNEVLVDGEYYNLDATWDAGKEEYDYFLKSDEAIASTHIPSKAVKNMD